MLRRRTPEPVPTRTSGQPPAMAGAVESPRDSPEDGKQHDSDAIDLSLLKLYDGQWMGAGHVAAQRHDAARRQSLPAADVRRPSPIAIAPLIVSRVSARVISPFRQGKQPVDWRLRRLLSVCPTHAHALSWV